MNAQLFSIFTAVLSTHAFLAVVVSVSPHSVPMLSNLNMSGTASSGALWLALIGLIAIVTKPSAQSDALQQPKRADNGLQDWKTKLNEAVEDISQIESIKKWSGWREFTIARKQIECADQSVCSFYLQPYDKQALPKFNPGQFLTFKLPNIPNQSKTVTRCYSLSDAYANEHYRVSIKRQPAPNDKPGIPPGISSNFFHDNLNEGDIVQVKAPAGHFFLQEKSAKGAVLIAGGVGVTPITSMAKHLAAKNSGRPVHVFYGAANANQLALLDELKQAVEQLQNAKLTVCLSRHNGENTDIEDLYEGRVNVDLFKQRLPSSNYEFYLCGPPPFMDTIVNDLYEWGVPEKDVHFEAFGPASVKKKQTNTAQGSFLVKYKDSEAEHTWTGSEDSLLDFTENQDIDMASGCRMGNCGACMTKLVEGSVSYPNGEPGCESLETDSCLPCVAVPNSNITLEA